jgi:hypothetical protein
MADPKYVCPYSAGGTIRTCSTVRGTDKAKASAAADMTAAHADLVYTAADYGYNGNLITVTHVNPSAASRPLSVAVSGSAITVNLATGSNSAITTTAAQLITAIEASEAAAALVDVASAEGHNGTGVVNALAKITLSGGVWTGCPHYDVRVEQCMIAPSSHSRWESAITDAK